MAYSQKEIRESAVIAKGDNSISFLQGQFTAVNGAFIALNEPNFDDTIESCKRLDTHIPAGLTHDSWTIIDHRKYNKTYGVGVPAGADIDINIILNTLSIEISQL